MFKKRMLILSFIVCIASSACGSSDAPNATPSMSVEQIQTNAVAEFSFGLTATALAKPIDTIPPTFTAGPIVTFTSPAAITPLGGSLASATPTVSCYHMTFVKDVTFPDNTGVLPGQSFTKTWRVKNTGTCPWDAGFKLSLVGGDAMGGTDIVLTSTVGINAETDFSVNMIAPNKVVSLRGDWGLFTTNGQRVGGNKLWVIVNVSGPTLAATSTPTLSVVTATSTDTPIATSTQIPPSATSTEAATATP